MHKFTTSSGKHLWYNVTNNRISLYSKEKESKACPVVHFNQPTNIDGSKITMFTIEMTQQCNLRCSYCCYSGKYRDRRQHNEKEISYDTLRDVVGFIEKHADKDAAEITVCFYGGEALLARKKIEWLIETLSTIYGERIRFSLSTNGLALTESIIDWIASFENFLVNVTIDGNKMMHDRCRKTITGEGSYDTIFKNLEVLKKKYPRVFDERVRFLSTVYSWKDVMKLAEVWDKQPILKGHYPVHISHILPDFNDTTRTYDTWETKDEEFEEYLDKFYKGYKGMQSFNATSENYAKSFGLSYVNFVILYSIFTTKNCTQTIICKNLSLPKQTVNIAITYFYKKGYIKLIENPENRREKTIHFTEEGKKYAENIILNFQKCEYKAIKRIGIKNIEIFIKILNLYAEIWQEEVTEIINK